MSGDIFTKIDELLIIERERMILSLSIRKPRTILGDWLLLVGFTFKLKKETLFEMFAIFSTFEVEKGEEIAYNKLQLYGVAAMYLACKKYEIYSPEVENYIYITANSITEEQLYEAVTDILETLKFNLEFPNVMEYIRHLSCIVNNEYTEHNLIYVMCLGYYIHDCRIKPSCLTSAAAYLVRFDKGDMFENPFSVTFDELSSACKALIKTTKKLINPGALTSIPSLNKILKDYSKLQDIIKLSINFKDANDILLSPSKEPKGVKPIDFTEIKRIKTLGEGTFGGVYKITHNFEEFAMKKTKLEVMSGGDRFVESFIREVSILSSIEHPNVISLKHVSITSMYTCLILELMDMDLKTYLAKHPNDFDNKLQLHCAIELVSGLYYLHSRGILHRDLKPQNILVNDVYPPILKYADFGACRGTGLAIKDNSYTHEICTLWWRSPDILLGAETYGPSLDVWSLMCILYELITLDHPFKGDYEIDQLFKIFMKLGTPSEVTWPGVTKYRNWKDGFPKFTKAVDIFKVKSNPCNPSLSVISIVKKGLILNPAKRPSINTIYEDMEKVKMIKTGNVSAKVRIGTLI